MAIGPTEIRIPAAKWLTRPIPGWALPLFLSAVVVASPSRGTELDAATRAKIDHRVEAILNSTGTPSASIAVIQGGDVVYVHAYGLARLSPPLSATPASRYQIASVSKEIVAAAALLLQQERKLSLDDKVAKWLPDLTAAGDITLRQCLTHTAGYPDFWPQDYIMDWMLRPTTTDELLNTWAKKPLSFAPGSSWQYSNTGYVIAGRIIEKAAGRPLFDFVNERIFKVVGIADAIDVNRRALAVPDALGYIRPALAPPELQVPAAAGWMFGAWQFALTAEDLARWDLSILHRTLLSPNSYSQELTTAKLKDGRDTGYALGLEVGAPGGHRLIRHDGEGAGYLAENRIHPDEAAAVVVLTNTFSGSPAGDIADAIDFILEPPTGVDAQVRAAFDALQHGHPDRTAFTPTLNAFLDERTVGAYERTLGPLGPPTAFVQTQSGDRGGMKFYSYRIIANGRTLALSVFMTPQGKFEQLLVAEVFQ